MLAATTLAPGQRVWMKNPSTDPESPPFLSGEVLAANGAKAEVLFPGTEAPVSVPEAALDMANAISSKLAASAERAEPDNCDLFQLSEATLLHNTLLRYNDDEIYTFTCAVAARPASPESAGTVQPMRSFVSTLCSPFGSLCSGGESLSPDLLFPSQWTHRHVSQSVQASSAPVLQRTHEGEQPLEALHALRAHAGSHNVATHEDVSTLTSPTQPPVPCITTDRSASGGGGVGSSQPAHLLGRCRGVQATP
jgi:hypothetical protein